MADLSRIPTRDELIERIAKLFAASDRDSDARLWTEAAEETIDALADVLPGDDGVPAGWEQVATDDLDDALYECQYGDRPLYRVEQP